MSGMLRVSRGPLRWNGLTLTCGDDARRAEAEAVLARNGAAGATGRADFGGVVDVEAVGMRAGER